eukprot:snap_masked-scaffold_17-processed-gene-1.19-mRNA-1 protein AED:1.00 eAED:1.00 QI:0/0/0/0/1/1/4/0/68
MVPPRHQEFALRYGESGTSRSLTRFYTVNHIFLSFSASISTDHMSLILNQTPNQIPSAFSLTSGYKIN